MCALKMCMNVKCISLYGNFWILDKYQTSNMTIRQKIKGDGSYQEFSNKYVAINKCSARQYLGLNWIEKFKVDFIRENDYEHTFHH